MPFVHVTWLPKVRYQAAMIMYEGLSSWCLYFFYTTGATPSSSSANSFSFSSFVDHDTPLHHLSFTGLPYRKSTKGGGRRHNQRWVPRLHNMTDSNSYVWHHLRIYNAIKRTFTIHFHLDVNKPNTKAITNNDVAKAADIPTKNLVVRFSEAWVSSMCMFSVHVHVVIGTTCEIILNFSLQCCWQLLILWTLSPSSFLCTHILLLITFYWTSVDGFALPPGHTHESLGLSNEEITEEEKSQ